MSAVAQLDAAGRAAGTPAGVLAEHERFPLVDAVRAFAALTIFAFHIAFHLGLLTQDALSRYLGNLNVGVPVFFVVSGFLLYRPFVAARLAQAGSPAPGPYAIRRATRIVPAYWVALPIVVLLLGTASEVFTPRGAATYFGFLQVYDADTVIGGIGQAWTLCVEVSFYVALPLWALLARRALRGGSRAAIVRGELVALALVALASVAWKLAATEALGPGDPGWLPAQVTLPAFADQFALGMAMAVVSAAIADGMRPPGIVGLVGRHPWLPLLVGAGLYALLGLRAGSFGQSWTDAGLLRHEIKGLIGVCVLAPAVFGAAAGGRTRRAMAWRPLLWLGLVSYSFYLYHLVVILKFEEWFGGAGWIPVAAASLAVSALVAWTSYRLVEAPGIGWGRR